MKLSSHTTSVLKNFSTINQNLVIKEGNTITTMSAMKNIVAIATIPEVFVKSANMVNGLLKIDLERIVPDKKKSRMVSIN